MMKNWKGDAEPITPEGFQQVLALLGVEPEALWAVLYVETSGCGFLSDKRPTIRFEGKVFEHYVPGTHTMGWGTGYAALTDAIKLDSEAAVKSTSWGIGQVMGENAALAGFRKNGPMGMIAAFADFEDAQILGAANYCLHTGIDRALKRHDWPSFAYAYNGPNYRKNNYDVRLATAFEQFRRRLPDIKVRSEQIKLMFKGLYAGKIDGILGPLTQAAMDKAKEGVSA